MKKILITSIALLLGGVAIANEPGKSETGLDYNKFEIDYASAKLSSKTYTGYNTGGSFLISDNIYVLGSYLSISNGSTNIEKSNLGLGFRIGIAPSADAFTSIAYASQTAGSTKTGYNASLGLRGKLTTDAELSGAYAYSTAGSSNYNTFGLSLKYNITDLLFLSGGYQSTSGSATSTAYMLGAGIKF